MSANSLTFAVEKEKSIVVMEGEASKKEIKRIPYGMMNFAAVREDNYYYVDKTRFIEKVENANRFFFFIRPRQEVFTDMEHSYIIELKYLKSQATDMEAEAAVQEAQAQVLRYADTVNVGENIGHTTLHKVTVVYRGMDMVACEAV